MLRLLGVRAIIMGAPLGVGINGTSLQLPLRHTTTCGGPGFHHIDQWDVASATHSACATTRGRLGFYYTNQTARVGPLSLKIA